MVKGKGFSFRGMSHQGTLVVQFLCLKVLFLVNSGASVYDSFEMFPGQSLLGKIC